MTIRTVLPSALALALSACLLAGCPGGANPLVRADAIPAPPPSPPPPPPDPPPANATAALCPPPITADCIVDVRSEDGDRDMPGGRQSDYALIKRGNAQLTLVSDSSNSNSLPVVDYRFGGGTTIEDGTLRVFSSASLHSNVDVQAGGTLQLFGAMTGNLHNHGYTLVWDKLGGDVSNAGTLEPGSSIYGDIVPARIEGNYRQTPTGTLVAVIPVASEFGPMIGGFLTVTGRADIDGTLRLVQYGDWMGPYPLPGTPLSVRVLHADGGVFGRFAQWTSPYLLVTGTVRYLGSDVYIDIASLSAKATMASAGAGDAVTQRAAGAFDAALASAGKWATPGATLSATRQRFLESAGRIQRLGDYSQAVRTFDSLAGHGYADAANALLQRSATPATELMARIGNLPRGSASGAWATPTSMLTSGAGAFYGERTGIDHWFGDRLLVGTSFGWSQGNLRFDRAGGSTRETAPQWDVYVRANDSADAYVFGDIAWSHHELDLTRQIDLAGAHAVAGTRSAFDMTRAYLETGRDFRFGTARLTPFGALSYELLRGAGFVERGSTGFELVAQPSMRQRLNAAAGVRLAASWSNGNGRLITWNVAAGYRQLLQARDDAPVAFAGAPDVTFRLDGLRMPHQSGWLQMNLATGTERWNWRLSYDRQASDQALSLGAMFRF